MSGDSKEQPNIFYTKGAPFLQAECLLNQGKVKSLYRMADEPEKVYIHFHDKVTAGNGRRVDFPAEKGKVCCLISALLFEYMEKNGIRTHYIDCPRLDTLACKKLEIIPVEVIVRNIAAGSIVKNTNINEGTLIFNSDPYEVLGAHFSNSSTSTGKLQISLKSYFQSVLMVDTLQNIGMKFYSSINNSLFDTVKFDLDNDLNRVEILYAAP